MFEKVKKQLISQIGEQKLIEELFSSFETINKKFLAKNPVGVLQNTGLFVEASLRVIQKLILNSITPLNRTLRIDEVIEDLEAASGNPGLRIHAPRLLRAAYDFRSRKKSVHLKEIDPRDIDTDLIMNIASWVLIEILKESNIKNPEDAIKILFRKRIPLVQEVEGILRTTDPKLTGPQRILLILYSAKRPLSEEQIFSGVSIRIKTKDHFRKSLKSLEERDLIHRRKDKRWVIFGRGNLEAEKIIQKFK